MYTPDFSAQIFHELEVIPSGAPTAKRTGLSLMGSSPTWVAKLGAIIGEAAI
jgi:hypothetical protein